MTLCLCRHIHSKVHQMDIRSIWCPSSSKWGSHHQARTGNEHLTLWGDCWSLWRGKAPHGVGGEGAVVQCHLMDGRSVGCCCANRWDSRESIFGLIVFWAINQKHFWVESHSIRLQHSSLGVVSVWRNSGFGMTQVGCEVKLKYSSEMHTGGLEI